MEFKFISDKWTAIGYLEMVKGYAVGTRLPFHVGITFIGRQKYACEFRDAEQLRHIVEGAQICLRADNSGCFVTDATSTNPTTVIRKRSCAKYLAGQTVEEQDDIIRIQYERLEAKADERRWTAIFEGDLLSHIYGCWQLKILGPHALSPQS